MSYKYSLFVDEAYWLQNLLEFLAGELDEQDFKVEIWGVQLIYKVNIQKKKASQKVHLRLFE